MDGRSLSKFSKDRRHSTRRKGDSTTAVRRCQIERFGEDKENSGATNYVFERGILRELYNRNKSPSGSREEKAAPYRAQVQAAEETEESEQEMRRERDLEKAWIEIAEEERPDEDENFAEVDHEVRLSKLKDTVFRKVQYNRPVEFYGECMKRSPFTKGSDKLRYTDAQWGAKPLQTLPLECKATSTTERRANLQGETIYRSSEMPTIHRLTRSGSILKRTTVAQKSLKDTPEHVKGSSGRPGKVENQNPFLKTSSPKSSRFTEARSYRGMSCESPLHLGVTRDGSMSTSAASGRTPVREFATVPNTPGAIQGRKLSGSQTGITEAADMARQRSVAERARLNETLRSIIQDHQTEVGSKQELPSWVERFWKSIFRFISCSSSVDVVKSRSRPPKTAVSHAYEKYSKSPESSSAHEDVNLKRVVSSSRSGGSKSSATFVGFGECYRPQILHDQIVRTRDMYIFRSLHDI
ncbi:hypothetical protein MPTK1_6g19950 [Marchantia polymorpha subsp. ruderalis]|uniref:Uncharacterized protein n=2 Tax=Marchantia polymorpha TaxID=3197 RepID=A0AAF6BTZ7_MARPO|nr:hypothetical protein MARPO_0045s0068 [Marchantia polymorpha]PTQ39407.1 hypothetical protein MARPO_0045s0068 [Marchantia polymorpha]BBN15481.1 hypothetical protein Mp_6g19950 [Marchantia polymorpha subsp. ruderalis]BBN15482.1 hypothetical protein Mp_6g19950 [Marchantia polymorpha subsp. ruderalis]|eukprot:PTQ39406.1 hypothetical protein MARPO_0045s0068 [Marchantia polymorpha]